LPVDAGAEDVGGHEVGGELQAGEGTADHFGKGFHRQRLGHAGHAFQQDVPLGQQADQHAFDEPVLADYDPLDLEDGALQQLGVLRRCRHLPGRTRVGVLPVAGLGHFPTSCSHPPRTGSQAVFCWPVTPLKILARARSSTRAGRFPLSANRIPGVTAVKPGLFPLCGSGAPPGGLISINTARIEVIIILRAIPPPALERRALSRSAGSDSGPAECPHPPLPEGSRECAADRAPPAPSGPTGRARPPAAPAATPPLATHRSATAGTQRDPPAPPQPLENRAAPRASEPRCDGSTAADLPPARRPAPRSPAPAPALPPTRPAARSPAGSPASTAPGRRPAWKVPPRQQERRPPPPPAPDPPACDRRPAAASCRSRRIGAPHLMIGRPPRTQTPLDAGTPLPGRITDHSQVLGSPHVRSGSCDSTSGTSASSGSTSVN